MSWLKYRVKELVKICGCHFLYYSGLVSLFRRFYLRKRAVILAYHQVTGDVFQKHLNYLNQYYAPKSFSEFVRNFKKNLVVPNSVVLTFDDGYQCLFSEVLSLIKNGSTPITVFLTTDFIDNKTSAWWEELAVLIRNYPEKKLVLGRRVFFFKKNYQKADFLNLWQTRLKQLPEAARETCLKNLRRVLSKSAEPEKLRCFLETKQIHQLMEAGVELGAHTVTHPILTRIPINQAEDEICGAREQLEKQFGFPVKWFSYPNGRSCDFNLAIIEAAKKCGFQAAVSLEPGPVAVGDDLFQLKRISINSTDSVAILAVKLAGLWDLLCS